MTSPEIIRPKAKQRPGDRVFSASALISGSLILAILAAVAGFLMLQGIPGMFADPESVSIYTEGENFVEFVVPLIFGTLWAAALALVMALPLAIGIALFISHYAPRRLAQSLGYIIDLLAAVPSVVFGLWGANVLAGAIQPSFVWLEENLGWIPLFAGPVSGTGRTMLTAAIVLAVMILPIITAISREVFLQTPPLYEEAALALGATRWEMIRTVVLPFGRPGVIAGAMLGLGRALGETMAVAMVLSGSGVIVFDLIGSVNPLTIAANVALRFPEAYGINVNVLIATGLILFAITLVVNSIARYIVNRRKDFSGAN
ncbi:MULTISPECIES: phosphate ABC transporter permease subunit PstC [Microcella]|uniref:phosphate ABC transporter permease subunit PstC n=1 Tax=Microcella TaxID=337004 RepID=UPI0015CF27DF|nr:MULTISPECIES: phosphate ABC transporter permease subunit PstC [Microcella]QOD93349.1 phosphate ABC transporter permease subunit PstC [Chryseoglobus sp. 28M-23]